MLPGAVKVQGEFEVSMELLPSNPELNPSPSMLESDQTTAGSADVRPRNIRPLLLIFGFLGLLAGLLVGGIYFTKCPKVYQSQATITIYPRIKTFGRDSSENTGRTDIRHDQLIGEDNILTKCLNKYNLKDLSTLRDLSAVKQIEEIQKNLVVVQNWPEAKRNDGLLSYDLEYFSTNPRDAQAVLATIISTYEKHLDEEYCSPGADTVELLLKKRDEFLKEVKTVDQRLQAERTRTLVVSVPSVQLGSVAAEMMEEIEAKKILLEELLSDLRKSEAALKDGREACMEYVWILENGGKLEVGLLDDGFRSPVRFAQVKKVFELYGQRDRVLVVSHPDPEVVQALNLRINEEEEKLRELTSNENKVREAKGLVVSPEEIIQRFITSKKKQIGELRTALKTDLATYSQNYEKVVGSDNAAHKMNAAHKIRELELLKEKLLEKAASVDRQIYGQQNVTQTVVHKGFVFITTRHAYRGRQVWPVLAEILPVFGLIGAVVGLGFAYLSVFVVRATPLG